MSSLWRVRLIRNEGSEVELAVRAVHPDAGPFSDSPVFALRLLADATDRLGEQESEYAYADAGAETRAAQLIDSVALSDVRNFPFDEQAAKRRVGHDLEANGLHPDDEQRWLPAFGAAWQELWNDPDQVPSAILTIRPADPSWLAGLPPGLEWETAAYP